MGRTCSIREYTREEKGIINMIRKFDGKEEEMGVHGRKILKKYIKERKLKDMNGIILIENMDQRWALVNRVMNISFP